MPPDTPIPAATGPQLQFSSYLDSEYEGAPKLMSFHGSGFMGSAEDATCRWRVERAPPCLMRVHLEDGKYSVSSGDSDAWIEILGRDGHRRLQPGVRVPLEDGCIVLFAGYLLHYLVAIR